MKRSALRLLLVMLVVAGSRLANPGPVVLAAEGDDQPLSGDFVPGQLIVRFKPGVSSEEIAAFYTEYGLAEKANLDVSSTGGADQAMRLVAVQIELSTSLVNLFESDDRVLYAEPNYILHVDKSPSDPDFSKLWGLNNSGQTGGTADADIDAPEAWEVTTGSSDVVIGIIDTGIDYNHEDLVKNLWNNPGECPQGKCTADGKDNDNNGYIDDFHGINAINGSGDPMDDFGHGTHVAGTIGAVGNNSLGVTGINWNVRIAACKFLSASGSGSVAGAIQCFQYFYDLKTKHKVNIVATSNSWGGAFSSEALRDAMAGPEQPLHICAAGNDNSGAAHFPAGYDLPNIIAVAATDHNDQYASFSNYGPDWVDLAAPGVDILSTVPKGSCPICSPSGYDTASGTSMATPHVSGAVALLYAKYPKLTGDQVKQRLLSAVDALRDRSKQTLTNGRLNLLNALEEDNTSPATVTDLAVSGVLLTSVNLKWTASGDDGIKGRANAYELRYDRAPISEATWEKATPAEGLPAPQEPGATETFVVHGLEPGQTYYMALRVLDNVGNHSELSNVVVARTSAGSIVFADDMEKGPGQWMTAGDKNLWHLSTLRSHSPSTAWYYGQEATRNYDTGSANNGTLTSQVIDVTGADDALLTFYEWSQLQTSSRLDRTQVQVSTDGQSWQTIFESHGTDDEWVERSVSLSPFITATGAIQLRFTFDSVDASSNNFEGWYIDDVQLLTAKLELPGQQTPMANLAMNQTNILANPPTPVTGDQVTLNATVLNNGAADANDVMVQFVNMTDAAAGAPPRPIGQPQTIANLPAGGSGAVEVNYAVDEAGERAIRVIVDPNNFVPEANEADNAATRALIVAPAPAPNLMVKSAFIGFDPPAPNPGDPVTIRATIFNTGTLAARAVTVQFADVTGSGSTPIAQAETITAIAAGGSAVVETTFDTAGLPGDRDIEVAVDVNNTIAETNESDNSAETKLKLTTAFAPNLNVQMRNIGVDPATPTSGDEVTIYATVLNDGNAAATDVAVQIMEAVGSRSFPIGPQQIVAVLPVGGSATVTMPYTISGPPGDRKIEVDVDPNQFIAEIKESDNSAQKTFKVVAPPAPNLAVKTNNINFSPLAPTEGDTVTIFMTVLNDGAEAANQVAVQFIDATNGAALPIGERQVIPTISPGGSGVVHVTYETLDKAGNRSIQVMVDPDNQILESNETDNNAGGGLQITPLPAPNLVMLASNIEYSPAQPTERDQVTLRAVVLNNGNVDAHNVLVQFIDLTEGAATPVGGEQYIDLLPAGSSGAAQAVLDASGMAVDLRLQVLVDSNNLIEELNEEDNVATRVLPISAAPAPNLVLLATNIGFNPQQPTVGEPLTISALVLNNGATDAHDVKVQFIDMTTGRPLPLGAQQTIETIAVGSGATAEITLADGLPLGEHLIRVVADPNNLIVESDEIDNRNSTTLTVVLPPTANLLVQPSNIGFNPPSPTDGEAVSVTATILNSGVATATDVLVQFVDVTDGGYVPVGAKQTVEQIVAGGSATAQVTFDTSDKAGERKIQVVVDPHAAIAESNEADNSATQTLLVAPPPAPNLVVQDANIGFSLATPSAGDSVTVTATILNNGHSAARNVSVQFLDVSAGNPGIPIDASQTISSIPPGSSGVVQVLYETANRSGDRRIQVIADANNLIEETSETDNSARKTLKVADPPMPNLSIQTSNIGSDPAAPSSGDQVTLYATVINDGNAAADHVVVQFVDVTTSSSPAPIGQPQTIASIPAGGSGVAQITYDTTTSAGLTTNDRRIQVVVDPNNFIEEGRESDNSGQKTITLVAEPAPNLSVATAGIGFDPAAPRVGDAVTIIATVLNDGNAPASNVTVQFLDATERPPMPIGQVQTIDLIPVGGSDVAQVVFDATGKSGSRRIQVVVDPNSLIPEAKRTDNTATSTLNLLPLALPNLVVQASNLGFNPQAPFEGDQVIVNGVILNDGPSAANDVAVQLMDVSSGVATPVGAPQLIGVLPPGSSGAVRFVYPSGGKAGERKLQLTADPNNFVDEGDESDNQATTSLRIAPAPMPNLKVLPANIKLEPTDPEQGDVVTATVTILNDGSADAFDVVVQFSDISGGSAKPIGAERTLDVIAAGSSSTLRFVYKNTDEPGERTLQVSVDPTDMIVEFDETDNVAETDFIVSPPIIPNLVIQAKSIVFAPQQPIEGDPVTVTVTILNQGTGDANDVVVNFVDVSAGGAELIGDPQAIAQIAAGAGVTASVIYNTDGKAGDRRIQVVADPEDEIAESSEDDNQAAKTLRVISEAERPEPQPNLVIPAEAISFDPITPTVGSPVTVTVTVTNAGEVAARDVIVEFSDVSGGGAEVIGRQMITGTLAVGRGGRARINYDTSGKNGIRTIQVTADPDDDIPESDETDNTATSTLTVTQSTTGTTDLPNLVVQADDIGVYAPDYVSTGSTPGEVTIEVTVLNIGAADARAIPLQFVAMTRDGWRVLDDGAVIDFIPAGGRVTKTVTYQISDQAGYSELRVLVDPNNTIRESNKADNGARKALNAEVVGVAVEGR